MLRWRDASQCYKTLQNPQDGYVTMVTRRLIIRDWSWSTPSADTAGTLRPSPHVVPKLQDLMWRTLLIARLCQMNQSQINSFDFVCYLFWFVLLLYLRKHRLKYGSLQLCSSVYSCCVWVTSCTKSTQTLPAFSNWVNWITFGPRVSSHLRTALRWRTQKGSVWTHPNRLSELGNDFL